MSSIQLKKYHIALLLCCLSVSFAPAQRVPTDDDVLKSALEKGKLVAEYWVKRSGVNPSTTDYYADICSFYGACILGDALGDSSIYKEINSKYNRTSAIKTDNIDNNSCGILPLHLYLHNNNSPLLKLGKDAADANIQKDGHFRNAVDDTYMTGSLMVQAFRATKDTEYLDFCVDFITRYMGNLQQSNGLYWHHGDISHQFWGRGNGWGAASTAELVQVIPPSHKKYEEVITGYKNHMKGLIDVQLESGMWPQLLASTDARNWEESSGTSMFLFALFTGLELGLLDKATYLDPAKKGWTALVGHLGSDGKLNDIAAGFWPKVGDANEYISAPKASAGNSHGTAGFLWAATAIVRYFNSQTGNTHFNSYQPRQNTQSGAPLQKDAFFDLKGRGIPTAVLRYNTIVPAPGVTVRSTTSTTKWVTVY